MSYTPRIWECCEGVRYGLKKVEIGTWNMDVDGEKEVPHGIPDVGRIVVVLVSIRDDADTHRYIVGGKDSETLAAQVKDITTTNVIIARKVGQFFDSSDFDSTAFSRGKVGIVYRLGP